MNHPDLDIALKLYQKGMPPGRPCDPHLSLQLDAIHGAMNWEKWCYVKPVPLMLSNELLPPGADSFGTFSHCNPAHQMNLDD